MLFKLDPSIPLDKALIDKLIRLHTAEKSRIANLQAYYGANNPILNRTMDEGKPNNKLVHPYAKYITDMAVGYFMGEPVTYKADTGGEKLLEEYQGVCDYNDEHDNNTTLSKQCSIAGHSYELLWADSNSLPRFKSIDPKEMIYVVDNTLEENPLYAIRYYEEYTADKDSILYKISVYDKDDITEYDYTIGRAGTDVGELSDSEPTPHNFGDVPVIRYVNNDELLGDFETVLHLIDAYDKSQSDTANDFEYFTDAYLALSGMSSTQPEDVKNMKNNRVMLLDENGKAEWLIKNVNDTALENYKNRLDNDIHKFTMVPNLTDEQFAGNVSGEAMKYKLLGIENLSSVKEQKFKKGLMRRIELIANFLRLKKNTQSDFTLITPVFTRNTPKNVLEAVQMATTLKGIVSDETLLGMIPGIEDPAAEKEKVDADKEEAMNLIPTPTQQPQKEVIDDEQA